MTQHFIILFIILFINLQNKDIDRNRYAISDPKTVKII